MKKLFYPGACALVLIVTSGCESAGGFAKSVSDYSAKKEANRRDKGIFPNFTVQLVTEATWETNRSKLQSSEFVQGIIPAKFLPLRTSDGAFMSDGTGGHSFTTNTVLLPCAYFVALKLEPDPPKSP